MSLRATVMYHNKFKIRNRERRVIERILRTGLAPKILRRKQMIFLPKTKTIDPTLDNSKGLPPVTSNYDSIVVD
ncbi:hypothetical protein PHMEG_00015278 [Phytophthora megakarya]|uniref:Uncharacterized protein n=1 Tax=Phytophthora megakarya TaxID=4795 RepID=A0A225W397_9STRA|nr:hypothetical protein PHMEG_00015278 [Phytophthora megakarya]